MAEKQKPDYTSWSGMKKLALARQMFLDAGVQKTGKNLHLEFMYFELADIVPTATRIFNEVGLLMTPSFTADGVAIASVFNVDKPDEPSIDFVTPFHQMSPIVANSGKVVTNEMQALGSTITYMRRYLWQLVLDIVEPDTIDPMIGEDEGESKPAAVKPAAKKKSTKPKTDAERKTIKSEVVAPAEPADELQITALKNALKALLDVDGEQESFVQEVAMRTNGFSEISKEQCEELINGITDILAQYSTEG